MAKENLKNFDCVAATQHLHEYFDSELKPDLRAVMERHLASCADCAMALAQLRLIETAHRRLDARLELPAEAYWQMLPQRVLERVKASEKRRLLALPKLPRLKSSARRLPAGAPAPKQDWLYLTSALQKFLRGPAKYVLPLAAVAAFCFFLIGELREKPATSIMTASAPEQPPVEAQPAREEGLQEKAAVSKSAPGAEAPMPPALARDQRSTLQRAEEKKVWSREALLANSTQAAGAGGGTTVGGERKIETPNSVALSEVASPVAETAMVAPELKPPQSFAANDNEVKTSNQPLAPREQEVGYRAETPASLKADAVKLADDQLAQSTESRAKKTPPTGRMGVSSAAMRAADNLSNDPYSQTLQRAQQTSDLKKREKIWRDFLKSNPDSSSQALGTAALARTLAAASDSTTKVEQLEKTLAFFREQAATLRAQIGEDTFDRELTRLQMLLNFRKAH